MKLNIYSSSTETACSLIRHIIDMLRDAPGKVLNIAFSGGFAPSVMLDLWANEFAEITPWEQIRFWWVDEKCVRPEHSESNYGLMRALLLDVVPVIKENIFRIQGESTPEKEVERYSKLVKKFIPFNGNYPSFDIVLLGVGEEGNVSSIFPGNEKVLTSSQIYEVVRSPYSGEIRITMTGQSIIHAQNVFFLVTGKKKTNVVIDMCYSGDTTPAAYIAHHAENAQLFIDEAIAEDLRQEGLIV